MPAELIDAVDEVNVTSTSTGRLVPEGDAALVAAAKTGDARAFEFLVQRHEGKIFSLAQRMTRNPEDAAALPLDFPDSGPNPEDSCLQREQERILCAAVNELKPGQRKAIELREFGELSTGETAQVMGLSVAAVKARLFHGRKELRQRLKRYVESTRTYRTRALRQETRWLSTLIGQKQALREAEL